MRRFGSETLQLRYDERNADVSDHQMFFLIKAKRVAAKFNVFSTPFNSAKNKIEYAQNHLERKNTTIKDACAIIRRK